MASRFPALAVLVLVATACRGIADPTTTTGPDSTSQPPATAALEAAARYEDLDYLDRRIRDTHPDPFWRSGEAAYLAELDHIRSRAAAMTDLEFGLAVLRLVALIDGHSRVATDVAPLDLHRFQVRLYDFDDGLYVVDAHDPAAVGARLVSVGGVPVEEALARIEPYVSRDNQMTVRLVAPVFLTYVELLEELGILDDDTPAYTVETPSGSLLALEPPALTADGGRLDGPAFGLAGTVAAEGAVPLYLSNAERAFWWTFLDDSATVYVQMNRITGSSTSGGGDRLGLSAMTSEIADLLERMPVDRVVLDLRHNPGGDNTTYGPVLDLLRTIDGDTRLFVLIGRNTFSAAMNLATEIENETGAVFAGEPTGARPNLYGDTVRIRLPNSGIEAHVSAKYWPLAGPGDERPWIDPAIAVPLRSGAFFAGIDPVLDAVLAYDP